MYLHLAFRDVLYNVIISLLVIMVLIMGMIQKEKKDAEDGKPMGSVVATITWPDGDQDVDLWVKAPGEEKNIGYSNKSGNNLDLLRDDMGNTSDVLPLNYENVVTRSTKAGEYTFNVHCFRCTKVPVPVTLEIRINRPNGPPYLKTMQVQLTKEGEEITVVNFEMDAKGTVDNASVNDVFEPLRAKKD